MPRGRKPRATNNVTLGEKIISQAKSELNAEKEKELMHQAKILLQDLSLAKKTVALLEKQVKDFTKELELY